MNKTKHGSAGIIGKRKEGQRIAVFQALDGAVVRRREEIAILRSLGVESRVILRAWLWEAALLGLLGGVVGLVLGWVGAFATLLPQKPGGVFPQWMLGFVAALIWAIQMRFFMVAYLS